MHKYVCLILLLFSIQGICQPIRFNYQIKDNKVVFKVVLKPQQSVSINYLDRLYASQVLNFSNKGTATAYFIQSTDVLFMTCFKIITVYVAGNRRVRYEYNISAMSGDSVLVDCTQKPFAIDAERLRQGQMSYYLDSIEINNRAEKKHADCDSSDYIKLEYDVVQELNKVSDSVVLYLNHFTEFHKSDGYISGIEYQGFSKSLNRLFSNLSNERKMDSCHLQMVSRFLPYFKILFGHKNPWPNSYENHGALYGYTLFNVLYRKMEPTLANIFTVIDSTLVGRFNLIAKLMFINVEPNTMEKHAFIKSMADTCKTDTLLKSYLRAMTQSAPISLPPIIDSIKLKTMEGGAITLKELIEKRGEKIYLLDFWASWCQPCIDQIIDNAAFLKKNYGNELRTIYISIDDDLAKWAAASKKYKLPSNTSLLVPKNEKGRLLDALEISTIPRFILVTSSGRVLSYKAPQPTGDGFRVLLDEVVHK